MTAATSSTGTLDAAGGKSGKSGPSGDGDDPRAAAAAATARARDWLLAAQSPEGWWKGELETNVTMDAEDLLMRHVLGILRPDQAEESARWIRSQQRPDGAWATWYEGPADLSTTVEAYTSLRLAGDRPDEPHMQRAARFVREHGGLPATRVFTRIWLALVGLWSWDELPVLPPELVLLPRRFPLALPHWGCWARQTIVPLAIVSALRPSHPVPFRLDELATDRPAGDAGPRDGFDRFFLGLDRALHRYERHPLRPLRRQALRAAAEWIVARQEADGSWGGIQPPWVYSLIALRLMGYALDHPVLAAGLQGLERFTIREQAPDGMVRRLEACQSPVWDTALALVALGDAGCAPDDGALRRAGRWLLAEEVTVPGDWAVRRPGLAPGGWAFEFDNDLYPDVDDTAEVVLALRKVTPAGPGEAAATDGAVRRAIDWVLGMQCSDGGWAAFDADQTGRLPTRLPFCDFGEVVDPPSADVTAHAVEMLAAEGLAGTDAVRRGVAWLLREQEADGSWFGRWGVNHVYGTGAVVPALIEAGVPADSPPCGVPCAGCSTTSRPAAAGARTSARTSTRRPPARARRRRRRPAGRCSRCSPSRAAPRAAAAPPTRRSRPPSSGGSGGWSRPSGTTAAGTSRTTPAPDSRGTSRSTTTSTGRSSRSPHSAATWGGADDRSRRRSAPAAGGLRRRPRHPGGRPGHSRGAHRSGTARDAAPGQRPGAGGARRGRGLRGADTAIWVPATSSWPPRFAARTASWPARRPRSSWPRSGPRDCVPSRRRC